MARLQWKTVLGAVAFMALGGLITYVLVPKATVPEDSKAGTPNPTAAAPVPADVLDLTNWKLTLPVGDEPDEADEVKQPDLATFQLDPYFRVEPTGKGVAFRAQVSGATTSGSGYPRSELREMTDSGEDEASWSNESGDHVMTLTAAITATPKEKPEVSVAQIHGEDDVVAMVRLEKDRLFVEQDGDDVGELDDSYKLGRKFTLELKATAAGIRVTYNGSKVVEYDEVGDDNYFKAGCYTQASDKPQDDDRDDQKYDKPDAYGEVVIYALKVQHS
jgi:hypothetical protein